MHSQHSHMLIKTIRVANVLTFSEWKFKYWINMGRPVIGYDIQHFSDACMSFSYVLSDCR